MNIKTNALINCHWAVKRINETYEIAMKTNDIDMLDDAHSIYEEFVEWINELEDSSNLQIMYINYLNR